MSASKEVMIKVAEALKCQETVDKMNQTSNVEEAYHIACEHMEGVSQEEFIEVIKELKETNGRIVLSEDELDVVAGGAAKGGEVSVGFKYTF